MKPNSLEAFKLEFEHQEDVIDYKRLLDRIKNIRKKKVINDRI